MLSSLFGDLRNLGSDLPEDDQAPGQRQPDEGFAATALLESVNTQVNEQGQMVDRHVRDLVVSGSPAQAIRDQFAATRADLDTASRQISLYDPTGAWASLVVRALSDASGRPIERLHLREQGTLRTLAMIERTTLERRTDDMLRIYHTEVRAPGADNAAIPFALMERSHMAVVIVGSLKSHAVDELVGSLQAAARHAHWRCPTLLFMLPPGATWIANKIAMTEWPARLKVQVLSEPLTSASAVWNSVLSVWNRVKAEPVWGPPPQEGLPELEGFQIKVADLPSGEEATAQTTARNAASSSARLDISMADHALNRLAPLEGVLALAIVEEGTGLVLSRQQREDHPVPLDLAAAASAQVLRTHQQASRNMGLDGHVDEIITTAGERHHVMRLVTNFPGLFLFAVLDKERTNLALARYKLTEAEQSLA